MKKITDVIANEVSEVLRHVNPSETEELADSLQKANRIFVAGTGRSGLIGKTFAMRLMHSGYQIYVVGETITPSIESNDLLLIISGSGSTSSLKEYATKSKDVGFKVALVTTNKNSAIGQLSNCIVQIPAATKKRLDQEPDTIQPLGSQFDQSAHLLLDAVVVYLLQQQDEKNNAKLNQKHANLE
ncbi:6-phospho-3-hexuloisomerase [Virgibacillus byunsanensis]|uniref:6-phospho-3-hexuloisomerase n=1 Tax=Virgibacillus byunsanensis TaxID=570945 RepID=A0ABW3LGP0_9BACI